jgi:hypothetical protein
VRRARHVAVPSLMDTPIRAASILAFIASPC